MINSKIVSWVMSNLDSQCLPSELGEHSVTEGEAMLFTPECLLNNLGGLLTIISHNRT